MKYRLQKIFAVWLLCSAAAFTACLREAGTQSGTDPLSSEAMLSLKIAVGGNTPRMRSYEDLREARPQEAAVDKVLMVLYGSDGISKYAINFNIRSTGPENTEEAFEEYTEGQDDPGNYLYQSGPKDLFDYGFQTYARRIARDDYDVLVVLNPTGNGSVPDELDLYKLTAPGRSVDDYLQAVEIAQENRRVSAKGGVAEDDHFLMTNHRGLVHVPAEWLATSLDGAHRNPLGISISRVAGKVSLASDVETIPVSPQPAWIANLTWGLDVTNKKTYWQRRLTFMLNGEMELPQQAGDYSDPPRNGIYAIDPNYKGFAQMNGGTEAQRRDNFNYLKYAPVEHPELPIFEAGPFGSEYCLENTMHTDEQTDDVSTQMVVRCQYFPPSYSRDESYFIYMGYVIDVPTMQLIYDGNPPAGLPAMSGLADDLTEAKAQLGAEYDFDNMESFPRSFDTNNVRYYHKGYNYYRVRLGGLDCQIPARANDNCSSGYGIIRNNHYVVKITNIFGPGTPTIAVPETGNIEAAVKVLPWSVRSWNVEL